LSRLYELRHVLMLAIAQISNAKFAFIAYYGERQQQKERRRKKCSKLVKHLFKC